MELKKTFVVCFFIAFAVLYAFSGRVHAYESPFNMALAYPPQMTVVQIAEADTEVLPRNWNRTYVAFASDYGQKMPDDAEGSGMYAELAVAHRIGRKGSDSLTSTTLYVEAPFLVGDNVSAWVTAYHDSDFREVYAGLAKKLGNWQLALGAGTAWHDGKSYTVIAPWAYYSDDVWEGNLLVERYLKDRDDPLFYKASLEKKFGDLQAGVYGEKGFGLGPMVTWRLTKNVKLWATVPVAYLPEEERMKVLIGVKLSTE